MDIDGISVRSVEFEYDWEILGHVLARALDREQASFLAVFAGVLSEEAGVMQIEYLADWLKQWPEDASGDIDALKWFLRELLERLEVE